MPAAGERSGAGPLAGRRGYPVGVTTTPENPESTPDPAPADEDLASLTFEEAMERLAAITDRIESGEIGLEASVAEWERGRRILAHCRRVLERAEQRVAELSAEEIEGGAEPDAGGGDGPDGRGA